MKRIFTGILAFSMALSLVASIAQIQTAAAVGAGTAAYRNTQQIANNLSYTNTISYINDTQRQESYALSLTGKGDAYPILMACDTIYGRLTIDQMISYAEGLGKNVLAAVNSDFFSMKTGVPMGLVVEDGIYKSSPECNTAVAFKADGSVCFSDSPEVTITLTNNGGSGTADASATADASPSDTDDTTSSGDRTGDTVTLTHFNKYRTDTGGMYLFSSAFSTVSTRTSSDGWFVRFKILSGQPSVAGSMSLQVSDIVPSDSSMTIGDGYLVLSAATVAGFGNEFAKFEVGDSVTMTTTCSDVNLNDAKWATGGGDILIKDGTVTDQSVWDKAIFKKNPRTAIGVKADGTIISYVIDGRESDNSSGLALDDLAAEMLDKGCVYAVNLDGGGSSAISVRLPGQAECAVVNNPSDGSERKCGAYLLFVTDKTSDAQVKYLAMQNDGPVVLAGSSVNLSYYGTDSGYKPAAAPNDVTAVSSGLGAVSGTIYTAGALHGVDKLTLTSPSTGATGSATIHIIYDPTDMVVTANGSESPVTALTDWPGDTVQLAAAAAYWGLPVIADQAATKYTVSGDIGTVSDTGLFTVGTASGVTGTITVSIGSKSVVIPVSITGFSDITNHWAKTSVQGLSALGIVTGVSPTTFAPDQSIRRGDFVLMLYRAAGKPAVTGSSAFTDVNPNDYYMQAIAWAAANNIARGDGTGLFNPTGTLTREQAFTLLYRAFSVLKIPYTDASPDSISTFQDEALVSAYALTPTSTLVSMGIVSGSDGKLMPSDAITRAGMAKILYAAMNDIQ
jgi:exopolysaccharide biosynthesis protein